MHKAIHGFAVYGLHDTYPKGVRRSGVMSQTIH